jgi:hypothetical protein
MYRRLGTKSNYFERPPAVPEYVLVSASGIWQRVEEHQCGRPWNVPQGRAGGGQAGSLNMICNTRSWDTPWLCSMRQVSETV